MAYIPAELAVLRCTLDGGVEEVLQAFLDPGPLPTGYTYRCGEHARRTHNIPLDGRDVHHGQAGAGFRRHTDAAACLELGHLLAGAREVFYLQGQEEQDRSIVSLLHSRAGLPPPLLTLLPLAHLFSALRPVLTPGLAEVQLQRERFLYSPGLSCAWHTSRTESLACCVAVARRAVYCLLELVCPQLDIQLLPGRHLPDQGEEKREEEDEWEPETMPAVVKVVKDRGGLFGATDIRCREQEMAQQVEEPVFKQPPGRGRAKVVLSREMKVMLDSRGVGGGGGRGVAEENNKMSSVGRGRSKVIIG